LSIDVGRFDVVRKLEIEPGEEAQEARGLTVLGILTNALQDLLDNDATVAIYSL